MFKYLIFACALAFAAASPTGLIATPLAYSSLGAPLATTYSAAPSYQASYISGSPLVQSYSSNLAYTAPLAYSAPLTYSSAYSRPYAYSHYY